jgi:electron transfer flavoprotein beta subunit
MGDQDRTGPDGPLIVVCLAPCDLRPEVDRVSGRVVVDPRRLDLNPSEAAALEIGLTAADNWGGSVVAIAAGPASVDPVLRQAVAVGAEALRVDWGETSSHLLSEPVTVESEELNGRPWHIAAVIAEAFSVTGPPSLVLCGDRSSISGTGSMPAFLAEHIGAEQALGCVSVAIGDEPGTVEVERRLDGGWRERLRVRGPAVVSAEAAGRRLRRAGLAATLVAQDAVIPVYRATGGQAGWASALVTGAPHPYRPRTRLVPAPTGDTRDRLLALTGALSNREPPRIVGPLGPAEAADELLDYLDRHGYGVP